MITAPMPKRDLWIRPIMSPPDPTTTLFCFPHAGGGPSAYRSWSRAPIRGAEVLALALPGREERFGESPQVDVSAIAAAIVRHACRPFVFFGHSMGALLAFAVQHVLLRLDAVSADLVWVSGTGSPAYRSGPLAGAGRLSDSALMQRLVSLGGIHPLIAADPDSARLFLPPMRADLDWLDEYLSERPALLPTPLCAVIGREDPMATPAQAADWSQFTTATFQLTVVNGGHFAAYEHADAVCTAVSRTLPVGSIEPMRGTTPDVR